MRIVSLFFFFFNDTATTEIYTLSLHDALPICTTSTRATVGVGVVMTSSIGFTTGGSSRRTRGRSAACSRCRRAPADRRSEEHTSELQSRQYLVCRLLLEKKKINSSANTTAIIM